MRFLPCLPPGGLWIGLCWMLLPMVCFPALADYQWPLDLPREITSSFGEFRSGRFHAGIDLRTGGNRPVRAIADGHVSRVRCAPSGYGKAIYLRLDDGRTAVYAHLNDYSDALLAYVREAQYARESYTVDLYPEADQFRVKRGDIIGETGQTGTSAPHLHFELREPEDVAISPYHAGLTWPDSTRPAVQKVLVAPRDAAARVNGAHVPVQLEVLHHGHARYETAPVSIEGAVGIGVEFIDPAPGGSKLGAQALRLMQREEERFRIEYDFIHYDDIGDGNLAYHPFLRGDGRFLLLWRWPGNTCQFYRHSSEEGWVTLRDAQDELLIQITDVAGNEATVTIPLRDAAQASPPNTPAATAATRGAWHLEHYGQALVIQMAFDGAEAESPVVEIAGPRGVVQVEAVRTGDHSFQAAFTPGEHGQYRLQAQHPRLDATDQMVAVFLRGGGSQVALGEVAVAVPDNAPCGMLPLRMDPVESPRGSRLPAFGKAYAFWPQDAPLAEAITLSFPLPPDAPVSPRLKMYRSSGGGWSPETTEVQGDRLVVKTRRLGIFQAMEDNQAPVLREVLPADGYRATTKRPYIRAKVSDVGSGISDFRVSCGDQWLLVAHDAVRGTLEWERDVQLPSGDQEIRFEVRDNAGNVTTLVRRVVVP